jgi:hypothetical protein
MFVLPGTESDGPADGLESGSLLQPTPRGPARVVYLDYAAWHARLTEAERQVA